MDFAKGGNVLCNPLIGPDNACFANGNRAENGGFCVDDNIILQIRVAFNPFDGVAVFVQRKAFRP